MRGCFLGSKTLVFCGFLLPLACSSAGAKGDGDGVVTRVQVRLEDTNTLAADKPYRLAIVWQQLNDDGVDPAPEIAYDVAVDLAIPEFSLKLPAAPSAERNLLCQRDCDDETQCGCLTTSPYRIGIATLILFEDTNANGKTDVLEDAYLRTGWGAFVYSQLGGDELPGSPGAPALIDGEIRAGVMPYEIYAPPTGFDRLRALPPLRVIVVKAESPNIT